MKLLTTLLVALSAITTIYSQVGINTTLPTTTLDIRGTNHEGAVTGQDGITVPRVNALGTSGTTQGQLVFLIQDDSTNGFTKGFHYWDTVDSLWKPLDTVKEPWNQANTANQATANTQNIYQMGEVGIGVASTGGQLHVHNDTSRDVILSRLNDTDSDDMDIDFFRGKGSNSAPALGVDGMYLGGLRFRTLNDIVTLYGGDFEGGFAPSAEIAGVVDGTVSASSSPGKIVFKTTSPGSEDAVERMVIKNDGKVGMLTETPNSTLDVNGSVSMNIRTLASGTIADNDYTILITGGVSLPTADSTNTGRIYRVINHNSNSNTVSGTFSINGGTFSGYTLNSSDLGRGIEIQSNGSAWVILSRF